MTQPDKEQSLAKRPDNLPANLTRGGLIVGIEQGIQGPLISVAGAAIERITRERTEVPPQFKLPERPVYFLNPSTRRLIMISNRENRGENKTSDKYGLFAEIVELDEEGKPRYRLSTSEIILPNDNYQHVAVGPNEYGFPPSHIEVVEEGKEGKKKFVPWNLYLGQLGFWGNNLHIYPNDDLETYIKRYLSLQANAMTQTEKKIRKFFKGGNQGFDENIAPVNLIICREEADDLLGEVSRQAGFYPLLVAVDELLDTVSQNRNLGDISEEIRYSIDNILGSRMPSGYYPAVITADWTYLNEQALIHGFLDLNKLPELLQRSNPIFSRVEIFRLSDEDAKPTGVEPQKLSNGMYGLEYTDKIEDMYLGLLNKLKADLLLTMFLRGGAPIVK